MLRVKKNSLILQEQSYYFEGEPFAGIAYALRDGVIQEVSEFRNGKAIGEFRDDYLRDAKALSRIDESELEGEISEGEEPFLYRQQRFHGIAYLFDGDFCVGEAWYDNGYALKDVGWYKSGKLGFYESHVGGITEYSTWYGSGARKSIKLVEQSSFRLEADLTEEEKVSSISIYGNYFDSYPAFKSKIAFPFLEQKSEIKHYNLAERLFLSSDGIDDQLFEYLVSADGFHGVSTIHVYNTSLTSKSIARLIGKGNIKKLIIQDNQHDLSRAAREFKASYPDCYVEFNRKKLD